MSIPKYVLDLDQHPEERWNHIIDDFYDQLPGIINLVDDFATQIPIFGNMTKSYLLSLIDQKVKNKEVHHLGELRGIAKRSGVELNRLVLMQLCYECFSACTSLIVPVNGKPTHFRTMDWALPQLKALTIELEVRKNDKELYSAITWVGCVGIFTGLKKGGYTVAINYRREGINVFNNLYRALDMHWPASYLVRELLESNSPANEVVESLKNTELICPCYFTLALANGEGVLLVRGRDETVDMKHKKLSEIEYIVQTNLDPGKTSPNILWSTERKKMVRKIVDTDTLTDTEKLTTRLLHWPVKNEETIYYCTMDPNKGFIDSGIC